MSKSKLKGEEIVGKENVYKMLDHLADGGNGNVWKAKCNNEIVAIKLLGKKEMKDHKKVARFKQEIEFSKKHNHKNIISVYDSGEFDNRLFYVMPLYDKTLRDIIQEEISISQIFNYILQICEGINFIHNKGVIHRDIKPENILLGGEEVVIADLGIAHFENFDITKKGELLANRVYAAPEQKKKGLSKEISKSVDIYALGCIVNELFTKENPLGTNFMKIADKYPGLNKLDNLVDRCMRQDPDRRPSIDEIILEINLIKGEHDELIKKIKDMLELDDEFEEMCLDPIKFDELLDVASEDILIAKYIFENVDGYDLDKYNINYNCHIHYKIDEELQKKCFNELLRQECESKFDSESYSYAIGSPYKSLDLNLENEKKLYDRFFQIMAQHGEINGKILKLFASCCNYHCKEILDQCKKIIEEVNDLLDAPILYIVKKLKNIISSDIKVENHIQINYEATKYDHSPSNIRELKSNLENKDEIEILNKFKEKYNIIYRKKDSKYSVLFSDYKKYLEFKEFAIDLARPHFIFEGDVLDIIKIKRSYDGIVELYDLDSFEVRNVLAKILGFRKDY